MPDVLASPAQAVRALELARRSGVLRVRDAEVQGIGRYTLMRLSRQGLLERLERGVYRWADAPLQNYESLELVAQRVPRAVFCLLTALQFYNIGTQLPRRIWIALPRGAYHPHLESVQLEVVQPLPELYELGIEEHQPGAIPLRVYSLEKTLVDCFKYRRRLGMEVVLEALRDAVQQRRIQTDRLWTLATACRMQTVMKPYLESLL